LLDYAFFQGLTAQIEAAPDADKADRLRALRTKILDISARQDEEARAAMQRANELLRTILRAEDPEAVARQHLDEINDAFFVVLSANIQRAEAENRQDLAQALKQTADMIVGLMQERLPPEIRLINQLLSAPYPDGTRQMLEAQRELLTPEFMMALDQILAELEQAGDTELAGHVRQIKSQAGVITQGVLQP
jgi:hypothetical protein